MVAGFAVSVNRSSGYYYMPIAAFAVLLATAALDVALVYLVPDVTICYRCLSQHRGPGTNPERRIAPFDIAIGERYRQERIRIEEPFRASEVKAPLTHPLRHPPTSRRQPSPATVDEQRARIYDDLRDLISGDLLFEPIERAPYAHDASLYEIDPLGVACPRTEDELAAIVRYASEHAIPLHARGAGTGLAGESLGPGLVVDFARHLRRDRPHRPGFVLSSSRAWCSTT